MATDFSDPQNFDASHEKLWTIIKDCRFAMLTTVGANGALQSRPMTTVQKNFGGTLWFFTPADSEAIADIKANENACVTYANIDHNDFVSLSGTAALVKSNAIKETLWNPMVQAWFPQGPTSPDVALLKVDVDRAEYWNSRGNKLTQALSMAAAYARGAQPKNIGEHRELKM